MFEPSPAALEPEDHVGGGGLEHEFKVRAKAGGAGLEAASFVDVVEALEFGFENFECGADTDVKVAGGLEEFVAIGESVAAVSVNGQAGEEEASALAELEREGGDLRGPVFAAEEDLGVAGEVFKTDVGERAAEVAGGDFFKLVGLVEDDGGGFREDARVRRAAGGEADGGVGEEEVVIDDD